MHHAQVFTVLSSLALAQPYGTNHTPCHVSVWDTISNYSVTNPPFLTILTHYMVGRIRIAKPLELRRETIRCLINAVILKQMVCHMVPTTNLFI